MKIYQIVFPTEDDVDVGGQNNMWIQTDYKIKIADGSDVLYVEDVSGRVKENSPGISLIIV